MGLYQEGRAEQAQHKGDYDMANGFKLPQRTPISQLFGPQQPIQQRRFPIEELIRTQGNNPIAQGITTAGNLLGEALKQRGLRKRQQALLEAGKVETSRLETREDTQATTKFGREKGLQEKRLESKERIAARRTNAQTLRAASMSNKQLNQTILQLQKERSEAFEVEKELEINAMLSPLLEESFRRTGVKQPLKSKPKHSTPEEVRDDPTLTDLQRKSILINQFGFGK